MNPFVDKLTEAELDEVEAAMTGRRATPPVPAGEVGELVERLSYLGNAIENEFNPTALGGPSVGARECGKPMLDAAALLERYAAALEELKEVTALLMRYRMETPMGHSPHMICHRADEAIERANKTIAVLSSPSSLR